MPTLRNKTTDKGSIIRWKPHPTHGRPSTYQVTPRAVSFLSRLGYTVPTPGDEVQIPPQVCRPLRLLGDLYFESESQEDIELSNSRKKGYYKKSGLSSKQLEKLRTYVESHPSYIGGFRKKLEKEIEELPGETQEKPRPTLDPDARSIRRLSDGDILLPEPFYIGKVDRLSNNQNAILSTAAGKHINLGRLPKSMVGEWTVGIGYRGHWTMCLTPQEWSSEYRNSVRAYIDELVELTGLNNLSQILKIQSRNYGKELHDSELEVTICYAGHGLGVAYHGEWTILVDSELVAAGQRIRVKIQEVYGYIGLAVPSRPESDDRISEGDHIKLSIDKIGQNFLAGTYLQQLVVIPRDTSVTPQQILIAISEIEDGYVTGNVNELDESKYPSVGDSLAIEEGKVRQYSDIPFDIPEPILPDSERIRLPVSGVNSDSISLSAKIYEKIGLFGNNESISSPYQVWSKQGLTVKVNDIPIVVNGGRYVPGTEIQVRLTRTTDGFVEGDFERFVLPVSLNDPEQGINLGNDKLGADEFEEAIHTSVKTVEMTDKNTHPELWCVAILQEIISVAARDVAQGEIQQGLDFLKIRHQTLDEETNLSESQINIVLKEIGALRQILKAKKELKEAEKSDNKTTNTEARQYAKKLLSEVTLTLNELEPLANYERPHWFIDKQLKLVADRLLLISPIVKEYIKDLT